ncbi:unnamed protein product [Musa hybrid cultivar]
MARLNEERGSAALPSKDDEEAFRKPTSEESKLPSVASSCPPAPRKTRRVQAEAMAGTGVGGCRRSAAARKEEVC